MKSIEAEMYSDAINFIVLRTPGRNFPGMVIQGDSLRTLYELASRIRRATAESTDDDLRDDAEELEELLRERLLHYECTLDAAGMALPYPETRRVERAPGDEKTR